MSTEIVVGVLALAGTCLGTFGGIFAANKLVVYRIEQLEKKVEKHNNLIDRTYCIEKELALHTEEIKVANHRIADLEDVK